MSGTRSRRPLVLATALVAVLTAALGVGTALPTAAAAPTSTSARDAKLVTFRGGISVRRESNVDTKLVKVPADFRRAVRGWLEDAYADAGSVEACSNTPLLTVYAYHRDGFARTSQGWFPTTGEPDSCAMGGYASIWSKRGGPWREVVQGQDVPSCKALSYHHVPRSLVDKCVDSSGKLVTY